MKRLESFYSTSEHYEFGAIPMRHLCDDNHCYLPDRYVSGETIKIGDIVGTNNHGIATVIRVNEKGVHGPYNYELDDGGFVIEYPHGGLEAWHEADEDIELVHRAE